VLKSFISSHIHPTYLFKQVKRVKDVKVLTPPVLHHPPNQPTISRIRQIFVWREILDILARNFYPLHPQKKTVTSASLVNTEYLRNNLSMNCLKIIPVGT